MKKYVIIRVDTLFPSYKYSDDIDILCLNTYDIINIPRFYGCFVQNNKDGIILENLYKYSGTFNINLNKNIDLLLKVIDNIFKMHNKFYFENSNNIINSMKTLLTVNKVTYYSELVNSRFDRFMQKNSILLTENNKTNLQYYISQF